MSTNFTFKPVDEAGLETLNVVTEADNFNEWMYKTIAPYCTGDILEIGSGTGNISAYFIGNHQQICLSDIRDNYCELLRKKFEGQPGVLGILNLDLVADDFDTVYKDQIGRFGTVFALNVVEHIENDLLAVANCKKLLKPGGTLVILVPAYQWLYNNFDRELYHYKRYNRKGLVDLFRKNGLSVIRSQSFNALGILGWFVSGSVLRKKILPVGQMRLFNMLVPAFKALDSVLLKRVGLSVIAVGRKDAD